MSVVDVPVMQLEHAADLPLPRYATAHSAGVDLLAAVAAPLELPPGGRALVATGLALALPVGYEAQVRPRSGLALKSGISVLNAPGTIDADYRGEVGVVLVNLGDTAFVVNRGDRIAQLVVAACAQARWQPVTRLPESARATGGFGSTGGVTQDVGDGAATTDSPRER